MKKLSKRKQTIIQIIQGNREVSRSQLAEKLSKTGFEVSKATVVRDLENLEALGLISGVGIGKATKYRISQASKLRFPVDVEEYFKSAPRGQVFVFDNGVFDLLRNADILSAEERGYFLKLKTAYAENTANLQEGILKREFERLTIDFSWKSSVIEGNTYDLLETEALIKEGVEAEGKPKEDAIMILNHKYALEHISKNKNGFKQLSVDDVLALHEVLVRDLGIAKGIRNSPVGISGTNYEPLSKRGELKAALVSMCELINSKENEFEKSLLALLLVAYIQPFVDGNKRTSRMLANALLIAFDVFPLSYRSVGVTEYKRALILFYETGSAAPFKDMFIDQCKSAAKEYFHVKI